MLISRFGTAYAGAYQISHSGEIDDWTITRPAVVEGDLWGMSGALDHYGTLNYPYGPMVVSKSFMATASTWAGVEAALESLTNNTIMADESKLWGMERNGSVNLWTYAKCTNLSL